MAIHSPIRRDAATGLQYPQNPTTVRLQHEGPNSQASWSLSRGNRRCQGDRYANLSCSVYGGVRLRWRTLKKCKAS